MSDTPSPIGWKPPKSGSTSSSSSSSSSGSNGGTNAAGQASIERMKKQFESSSAKPSTDTSAINEAAKKAGFVSGGGGGSGGKSSSSQSIQDRKTASGKATADYLDTITAGTPIIKDGKPAGTVQSPAQRGRQEQFDKIVEERQRQTGMGDYGKHGSRYHADRAKSEAALRVRAEQQYYANANKQAGPIGAGYRRSDGSRVTSATGSAPRPPTEAEIGRIMDSMRLQKNLTASGRSWRDASATEYEYNSRPTENCAINQGYRPDTGNSRVLPAADTTVAAGATAEGNSKSRGAVRPGCSGV